MIDVSFGGPGAVGKGQTVADRVDVAGEGGRAVQTAVGHALGEVVLLDEVAFRSSTASVAVSGSGGRHLGRVFGSAGVVLDKSTLGGLASVFHE